MADNDWKKELDSQENDSDKVFEETQDDLDDGDELEKKEDLSLDDSGEGDSPKKKGSFLKELLVFLVINVYFLFYKF